MSIKTGKSGGKRHAGDTSSSDIATGQEEQYVNSDEELENVLDAMRHSRPKPLAQKSFYFVKRRRQCYRLHDILLDTITPKNNSQLDQLDTNNMFHHRQQQHTPLRSVNTSISGSTSASSTSSARQNELALPTLIRIPGIAGGGAMRGSGPMNGGVLRDTR